VQSVPTITVANVVTIIKSIALLVMNLRLYNFFIKQQAKYKKGTNMKSSKWSVFNIIIATGLSFNLLSITEIHAANISDTLKWSYKTGDNIISSPKIGSNGTIYPRGWDHKLYAINSASSGYQVSPCPKFKHDNKSTSSQELLRKKSNSTKAVCSISKNTMNKISKLYMKITKQNLPMNLLDTVINKNNINCFTLKKHTLLYDAAQMSDIRLTKYLINRGANKKAFFTDMEGTKIYPFHFIITFGIKGKSNLELYKTLWFKGINVNVNDLLRGEYDKKSLKFLLKHITNKNMNIKTMIKLYVSPYKSKILEKLEIDNDYLKKQLVSSGIDLKKLKRRKLTTIIKKRSSKDTVKIIKKRYTLVKAVKLGYDGMLRVLLDTKIDTNSKDYVNAVNLIIKKDSLNAFSIFYEHNSKILNKKYLDYIALYNSADIREYLQNKGLHVNMPEENLLIDKYLMDAKYVEKILLINRNSSNLNPKFNRAFLKSVEKGYYKTVKIFTELGIVMDSNYLVNGIDVLALALKNNHISIFKHLLHYQINDAFTKYLSNKIVNKDWALVDKILNHVTINKDIYLDYKPHKGNKTLQDLLLESNNKDILSLILLTKKKNDVAPVLKLKQRKSKKNILSKKQNYLKKNNSNMEKFSKIIKLKEKGFIIAGVGGGDTIIVAKLDNKGNRIWSKIYGYLKDRFFREHSYNFKIKKEERYNTIYDVMEELQEIQESDNGNFILIGNTYFTDNAYGNSPSWVMKINKNGKLLWFTNIESTITKIYSLTKIKKIDNYVTIDGEISIGKIVNLTTVRFDKYYLTVRINNDNGKVKSKWVGKEK
jgi:outer membrane protein assembly factor BamB